MTYEEKLKLPQWRLKRSEILARDGSACQKCGHVSDSNDVHHVIYYYDRSPWDYPDECLLTLCRKCHDAEHNAAKSIKDIFNSMRLGGILWTEIKEKINLKFQ